MPGDIGPQYARDNAFTKKARKRQSVYRLHNLNEVQFGFGPMAGSSGRYGNMLVAGEQSGKNFILDSSFRYAQHRVQHRKHGETIDAYRLFNNMLSSMPLCFNLVHPLSEILQESPLHARDMLRAALPDLNILSVTAIDLEFIPTPIADYLNDRTAMDAVLTFLNEQEEPCLLAIEVKYTEPLGANGPSDPTRHIAFAQRSGLFTDEGLAVIQNKCSQIYRNFLLAEKYAEANGFAHCYSLVLAPQENPYTAQEVHLLRKHLKPEYAGKLHRLSLEQLVQAFRAHVPASYHHWLTTFEDRYLNFFK
ncbi:MAG: hypothetical protein EOO11_05015 [Chitinophagaceae bacterium]|nr:MAG: hypothetical protein EOO11_05015 [Chitinophagaceae bacterium]